jgi:arsenite methyltransferase
VPSAASFYESGLLQSVNGPILRPGGLELTDRAVELCRFPVGAHLLDVGCGSGVTVEHLRETHSFNANGVDISHKLIVEGLLRNPDLPLLTATADALPFAGESLDGIFCECVLSLLKEPVKALKEFYRTLRTGGRLIISDMYSRQTVSDADFEPSAPGTCGRGMLSRKRIESRLVECGFTRLLWEDHTRLLKELAARIILTRGSLEGFPEMCRGEEKPGYYLLVARKDS